MGMERLELAIDREMMAALRREAAAQGVSVADLVREALATYLDLGHVTPDWEGDEDLLDEPGEDDDWRELERELTGLHEDEE